MMMMMTTKYKITIMTGDVTLAGNKEHGAGGLEEEQADAAGFQIQTQTPQHTPRSAKAQRSPVAGFLQLGPLTGTAGSSRALAARLGRVEAGVAVGGGSVFIAMRLW